MAYLRTPSSGGVGETYLDIIVQDLQFTPSAYDLIDVICLETGEFYDVRFNSGAGGTSGTYRTGAQRFYGLTPGTYYNFYALTSYGGGSRRIPESGYYSFQTTQSQVQIGQAIITSLSNYQNDSITVNWASASNAVYYEVQYKRSSAGIWSYAAYSQNDNSFEVSGLDPSTDYDFRVRGYQGSSYGEWSGIMTGRTLSNVPTEFNWTYAKGQGAEFNLTANEWNALTAKINQFREYKFGPGYESYFTTALQGEIFYAYMANEARNAINELSPSISPPAFRYSDDIVEASILNRLRDSLNSVS